MRVDACVNNLRCRRFPSDYESTQHYSQYELSNFGLPHYHSVNNSAYWQGNPYLGIGPSAHSFYANQRSWNIANNKKYIQGIQAKQPSIEREELSKIDQYNEFVMTG